MSWQNHDCEKVTGSKILDPHRLVNCIFVAVLHVLHSSDLRFSVELLHTRGRHQCVFLLFLAIV